MLSALSDEMVLQVIDLVDTLLAENQLEYFKAQLLDIHQLSDYEKFDLLTFEWRMDRIMAGLDIDVIIGSRSVEEHVQHLRTLFQRLLQVAGLVINREKCVFGVEEVEFLGVT